MKSFALCPLFIREQLDNPHKQKTWGVWSEKFSVEIIFENP